MSSSKIRIVLWGACRRSPPWSRFRMATAVWLFPEVGDASSRGRCRPQWTDTGRRLYDVFSQYRMRALSACGPAKGSCPTRRNPGGQGGSEIC
eukprot:120245-Pyramimonas_sp.AAC.1